MRAAFPVRFLLDAGSRASPALSGRSQQGPGDPVNLALLSLLKFMIALFLLLHFQRTESPSLCCWVRIVARLVSSCLLLLSGHYDTINPNKSSTNNKQLLFNIISSFLIISNSPTPLARRWLES